MIQLCRAAALPFCLFLTVAGSATPGQSQPLVASPPHIETAYEAPKDAKFQSTYQQLKQRKVLERLQGFLEPLRLPRTLAIRTAECGTESAHYKSNAPVTLCYELVSRINGIASQSTKDPNEQALINYGTFVETVLHHVAYALFDVLQAPILGREDDAADRLAALTMMQFGDQIAYTTIIGTGKFFEYSKHTWTGADFASERSPDEQRFYNYLCIAYGGDPLTFQFLAPRPGPSDFPRLTEQRAPHCAREYQQVRHAFDLRIMPFVDPNLLIKVRAAQWLQPDEIIPVSFK